MSTHKINMVELTLLRGNIVEVQADAIVNAANTGLAGGGGVDGAIHRAGGPDIMESCRKIGGCPTGSAVATPAGNLHATYIFHAVGPVYSPHKDASQFLAGAYQSCLNLAEHYKVKSIAFPSLSTGAYGYPLHLAAPIALKTIIEHIQLPTSLQQVQIVLLGTEAYTAYDKALKRLIPV